MKKLVLALSLALTMPALAIETNCDKFKAGSYDKTFCVAKLFVESDKELNDVYTELMGKLNREGQKALKEAELKWIKYRNSHCEREPGIIKVDCSYEVNRDRANFLRDRLRECNSRMCDNDAVGKQSWLKVAPMRLQKL